jgi:hypothetical protein
MPLKPLKKATLVTQSALYALANPVSLFAGAAGAGAVWWLHDPLPAVIYGVGAAGWVVVATTTRRYKPRIEAGQRRRRDARDEKEREALREKTAKLLDESPIDLWLSAGFLPDYLATYARLTEIRNRVAKVLAERKDLDSFTKEDILRQLGTMLHAYLSFVQERVSYLHILATARSQSQEVPAPSYALPSWRKDWRRLTAKLVPVFVPQMPSLDKRVAEVDDKIRQLRDLAAREPATAPTREFHIGILEKQRELLLDCRKRDQCVVAQLGAFADAFDVIHGRLSAAQFSATEVASYMSHLVEQITETERFVETLRPAMNGLLDGLDPHAARIPPTAWQRANRS